MEIKVTRSELLKGLGVIQGIVERKTTMPILTNFLLGTPNEKGISITATDVEVGINYICPAEVSAKGEVLVQARKLYDIVRELPEEPIRILVDERQSIGIECGRAHYKIVGLPTADFPALPSKGKGGKWKMEREVLLNMMERTSFAMSNDETRFSLNGIYVEAKPKGEKVLIKMVATDGHRLSIVERDVGADCGLEKGIIIPRKGVAELKKLLEGGPTGTVDLWVDQRYMIVYSGNITLAIRLVDGQFPPYDVILSKKPKHVVSAQRQALIGVLRRVSVLTTDRTKAVKFKVSSGNLEVSAVNPDVGEAQEELDISYRGETFEIGFNPRYFVEALSIVEDEQAVIEMGDDSSPSVLRSELDRGFTHVIMPMRL